MALGVDLAVNLRDTGLCQLISRGDELAAVFPAIPETDDDLLNLIAAEEEVVGIDVPLGWPADFAAAVARYMAGPDGQWTEDEDEFAASYFRLRETDKALVAYGATQDVKLSPMSITADKLGAPAMKAAWIMSELSRRDDSFTVDRTGREGMIVEVYPAAAIKLWQLDFPKYKNLSAIESAAALATCREKIAAQGLPISGIGGLTTEHQLDALICALVARAARRNLTVVPDPARHSWATLSVEGWIHAPKPNTFHQLA